MLGRRICAGFHIRDKLSEGRDAFVLKAREFRREVAISLGVTRLFVGAVAQHVELLSPFLKTFPKELNRFAPLNCNVFLSYVTVLYVDNSIFNTFR